MGIGFVARASAAQASAARVADDESTAVGWFDPDDLPEPLASTSLRRIEAALAWLDDPTTPTRFHR